MAFARADIEHGMLAQMLCGDGVGLAAVTGLSQCAIARRVKTQTGISSEAKKAFLQGTDRTDPINQRWSRSLSPMH
jgi:hypothetical protein